MHVLAFGEILWDVFVNEKMIGGAAYNFGAHLARLGAEVEVVTAVGDDKLGEETREHVLRQGVGDNFLCISPFPTGTCQVTVNEQGVPSYDLVYDVAYDHIDLTKDQWDKVSLGGYDALYFGTLAQRHFQSCDTLQRLLRESSFEHILFDVNIRQKWYDRNLLRDGLFACTILKVSDEEMSVFEQVELTNVHREEYLTTDDYLRAFCLDLAEQYSIRTVLLTLGKEGALVYHDAQFYSSPKPHSQAVSTVGAGDSFAAAWLYRYLRGDSIEQCTNCAVLLSDFVVQHVGALPEYTAEILRELTR